MTILIDCPRSVKRGLAHGRVVPYYSVAPVGCQQVDDIIH